MRIFINNIVKITSFLLANVLLVGCATLQSTALPQAISWQQHQINISKLTSWHITGKIGVINGNKGGSANVEWKQYRNNFAITLYGPFRSEQIQIIGKQGEVKLLTSTGSTQTAVTPEKIIKQQLGWNVPVTGLMYWSKGIPMPGVPIELIKFSKEQRLTKLVQQGWTIEYQEYKSFNKFTLPTKFSLQYEKIKIKLIFKSWL